MTVRRATAPVGDPFWDTFLARHPDVDLVLLPLPDPGATPDDHAVHPPVDEAAMGTLRTLVDGVSRHVAAAVLSAGAALGETDDAVMSGPSTTSVRARSLLVLPGLEADAVDLAPAASALGARWSTELRDGLVGRLVGRSRVRLAGSEVGLELLATWAPAPGVLQVETTSEPVEVGTALAEELLAARRTRRTDGGAVSER